MSERNAAIAEFLDAHGWRAQHRAPLSGDASFRTYERLTDGTRRAVFMDAPPDQEDVRPFWGLAQHLTNAGYSAPKVFAGDAKLGALLLEDFGDGLFSRMIKDQPNMETPLYEAAVDVLADLHAKAPPEAVSLPDGTKYPVPTYSDDLLMSEVDLFPDWYLPAVLGEALPAAPRTEFSALWRETLGQMPLSPRVLVLRDYHADNLIWLPDRAGIERVGLLDFQDAVAGHPAYDLVSLLEDARRDVPPDLAARMTERYITARTRVEPDFDSAGFQVAYAILGAQRNTKIIGIFTRLWKRDGKPIYLDLIPRVWGLLERDLQHPTLSRARDWFTAQVPIEVRGRVLEAVS